MNHEDVQKLSNAANAKITLLQNDFLKYFMRAIMAGFFIVVAMIFSVMFCRSRGAGVGQVPGSTGVLDRSPSDLHGRRRAFYRK